MSAVFAFLSRILVSTFLFHILQFRFRSGFYKSWVLYTAQKFKNNIFFMFK